MDIKNVGASLSKIKDCFPRTAAEPLRAATTQPLDPKVLMPRDEAKMQESAREKINLFADTLDFPLDTEENTEVTIPPEKSAENLETNEPTEQILPHDNRGGRGGSGGSAR